MCSSTISGYTQIKCTYWISRNESRNLITDPNYLICRNVSKICNARDAGEALLQHSALLWYISIFEELIVSEGITEGTKFLYKELHNWGYVTKRMAMIFHSKDRNCDKKIMMPTRLEFWCSLYTTYFALYTLIWTFYFIFLTIVPFYSYRTQHQSLSKRETKERQSQSK